MKKLLFFIILSFTFWGCATAPSNGSARTNDNLFEGAFSSEVAGRLSSIDKWCIGFKYSNITIETKNHE